MFIQSHNIYSWHNINWIYTTPILSEYHFLGVYRSNPFVSYLVSVYEISSYIDIASILSCFLTIKEIVAKYFSKTFGIYIPILVKKLLGEALMF